MERRTFLRCCAAGLSCACCGRVIAAAPEAPSGAAGTGGGGLLIADPHAHPGQLHGSRSFDPSTPSIEMMQQLNMTLCCFAAVGDMAFARGGSGMPFADTRDQLEKVRRLEQRGQIRLTLKSADIQRIGAPPPVLLGLMSIEGGDALEGRLGNLDAFHDYGVRLLQLMHDRDNQLGFNQRSGADGPLSPFGKEVVERMNKLGMLVDVAHARSGTLKSVAEVSAAPLIDSHTGPFLAGEEGAGSQRLRTWHEMEIIAKGGGVVCTWPFAHAGRHAQRSTLKHWAAEIVEMKARLGMAHCGLGTDGGGGLPRLVTGWESIASLPKLIDEMRAAGLSQEDVAAYVGGNFLRVLGQCLA